MLPLLLSVSTKTDRSKLFCYGKHCLSGTRHLIAVFRKPIDSLNNNGSGPRMPMTISSMSVQTTKQIEEINKKFGDRVIKGDSVQKFNDLIELLVNELKLMAEDRERMVRNHQELTEQMNLSHSTILDIKDSR